MEGPSAGAQPAPQRPRPAAPTDADSLARRVWAIILILLLVGVTGYWYLAYGSVTTVSETVSQGRRYVDVPLMEVVSPPPVAGVDFRVAVTFGSDSSILYRWSAPDVNGMSVEFVLRPSSSWFGVPAPNLLRWTIAAGTYGSNSSSDRVQYGIYGEATVDYIVRKVVLTSAVSSRTFLEVECSVPYFREIMAPLPAGNMTLPGASDLLAAGVERSNATGTGWKVAWSLADFDRPAALFRASAGPVAFDAGSYGTIAANITSERAWGPGDDYVIEASGSGDASFDFVWYWDMRFGSLFSA